MEREEDSEDSLRDQLEEYARRFRILDEQMRVLERERQKLSAIVLHTDAAFLVMEMGKSKDPGSSGPKVVWANSVFVRRFMENSRPESLLGQPCHRVLCDGEATCERCPAVAPFRTGSVAHHELRLESQGRVRHLYATAMPIKSLSGEIDQAMVMLQDVSDLEVLRQSQEALKISEERFRSIFENAAAGMTTVAPDGRFLQVNPAFCRFVGYSREELLARSVLDVTHPDERPAIAELFTQSPGGPPRVMDRERRYIRKDGTLAWGHTTATQLLDARGSPSYWVALVQDLGPRKQAEEALRQREDQLRHSQKMEAVGTLAGGVAHDFNNILTGILGYAEILKLESKPGDRIRLAAEVIEKGASRAAALTQQLLGFARKGKNKNVPVDIHATLQEVVDLLGGTLSKEITVRQELSPEAPWVRGDPVQLGQVILNLGVNAADAMPGGGHLTFRTRVTDSALRSVRRPHGARGGRHLVLTVSDTGFGIPEEVRGRIFEPFFTTKESGKGTGMGLAMVYGIVQNHGGFIEVDTEVGRGTTFSVHLPLTEPSSRGARVQPRKEPIPGSGRILVVDDEQVVRDVAGEFLRNLGYQVVTASDGQEAVDAYRSSFPEIDLVILDMVMPRMGGRECFREMKAINPAVRVVLSTGYGFNVTTQEILDEGMAGFIQKPYQMRHLSEVVAAALKP
jgi:two-component system, cell cycle sensor histidine kinase and response regulator CckA